MILTSYKREYYILAGKEGLLNDLKKKGIEVSPTDLLIVSENSKIGRLIKKEAIKRVDKLKGEKQ